MHQEASMKDAEAHPQTGDMKSEMGRMIGNGWTDASCYAHSFGPIGTKSRYQDAFGGIDERPILDQKAREGAEIGMKALTTTAGGAGTAGYALVPVFVMPEIVDQSRKFTPLCELIPRVTNMGMTADYNIITAKGAAYTANQDASLPEADDTEDRASKSIKFLYSVGRVTGQMQAAMPSYIMMGFNPTGDGMRGGSFSNVAAPNAMQYEVLKKARALKELEENLIVNGNATTDATQFDGIVALQSTTNQTDLDGAALQWADVEEAVQNAFDDGGRPKLAIASSAVVTSLRKIMVDQFRYSLSDISGANGLSFGVPAAITISTMVGPVVVIPSMFLSNTSGARQIFFLDTDVWEMRVLQDMTYEKLAKTNDSEKFMLKIYEVLICRATGFNSFIDNIGAD